MSIFEYDREKHMAMERKENFEEGYSQGLSSALITVLENRGELPERVVSKINETTDREVLQRWIQNVAETSSLEEFLQKM